MKASDLGKHFLSFFQCDITQIRKEWFQDSDLFATEHRIYKYMCYLYLLWIICYIF